MEELCEDLRRVVAMYTSIEVVLGRGGTEAGEWLEKHRRIRVGEYNHLAMLGAHAGNLVVVKWAVKKKGDWFGWYAAENVIRTAVSSGKLEVAEWLLFWLRFHGPRPPKFHDVSKHTILVAAAFDSVHTGEIKSLEWVAKQTRMKSEWKHVFTEACWAGRPEVILWINDTYPDYPINPVMIQRNFVTACSHGKIEVVKTIKELYPATNIHANDDEAFMTACVNRKKHVARWLWEQGVTPRMNHAATLLEQDLADYITRGRV